MNEEALFAAALERPSAAERQAFLDAACGGDVRLRNRVWELLAADEHARGILDQGAAALLAVCRPDRPLTEALRSTLEADPPGYELAEKVGEGGMGVVYRARDTALDRDVAIKVLRAGLAADGPIVSRFLGEARVTARLQHPGVPPVHQVGALADGRPFLVMKLIQGQTLAERLADGPADRGPLVAAFEHVCQAVAYAHSRGVVHRDLKPQNVMVGAFAEVQVMDWGLAKVLPAAADRGRPADSDETVALASAIDAGRGAEDETRTGSVLGTPAYMPPEQAIGAVDQIDERSDVFGLGAILCAILTGKPPYVGGDSESTRQMAARGRLTDAFTRLDGCGADPGLVALCQRCLAAEKADRPADAGEVAKAVAGLRAAADGRARQAELDRVRIEGERARAEAEAREQRKRRRAQLALAAAVGLLLLGAGAFGWHADRQAAGRDRDERARRDRTAEAVAALLDECEEALRADQADRAAVALGAADRRSADGVAEELAGRLARCRANLRLLRELNAIDTFRWGQEYPRPTAVAARWRSALADYGVRPDEDPAEEAAGRVGGSPVGDRILTALDEWLALDPSAGLRAVLRAADPDPYRDAFRDAVAARDARAEALLGGQPAALAQPARFAAVLGHRAAVPADRRRAVLTSALRARPGDLGLLMGMGIWYGNSGREGAGERARWFQAAVAAHPGNLAARVNLGNVLRDRQDLDGAIATFNDVLRVDPGFARAHVGLGRALLERRELPGAFASFREAIRLDPEDGYAHFVLGGAQRRTGDPAGAIASFKEAVRLYPLYADAHYELGLALRDEGDLDAAVACFREAVRVTPDFLSAQESLGEALRAQGDLTGAVAAYREVVRLDRYDIRARYTLANALFDVGDLDAAVAAHRTAIQLDTSALTKPESVGKGNRPVSGPERAVARFQEAVRRDPKDARAHYGLGFALGKQEDRPGALAAFREAVRLDPTFAPAHVALGDTLRAEKESGEAVASFREAVRLRPDFAAAQVGLGQALAAARDWAGAVTAYHAAIQLNPKDARAYSRLGSALRNRGDRAGAVAAYREAVRLSPEDARAHYGLGFALRQQGDRPGAVASYKEAIQLDPTYAPAHIALGDMLWEAGDRPGAVASFREAVRQQPDSATARFSLGEALRATRDVAGAVAAYQEAIKLNPTFAPAHIGLADARLEKGDLGQAIAGYEEGIRLNPKHARAHNQLAWLMATGPDRVRDGKRAVAYATRACELTGWKMPTYRDTLAAAYAESGDFDQAVEHQRTALAAGAVKKDSKGGRERLALYEQRKPYRDPDLTPREVGPPPREVKR